MNEVTANESLFFGRESLMAWIQSRIDDKPPRRPIILQGESGVGKTAVLRHLEAGAIAGPFTATYLPVYIDLADLDADSLSQFFWKLSDALDLELSGPDHAFDLPTRQEAGFAAAPYKAFDTAVLQPITDQLNGRKLLLLFDNLDVMQQSMIDGRLPDDAFTLWQKQMRHIPVIHTIYTLSSDGEASGQFLALNAAARYDIEPLPPEATLRLARTLSSYTFYSDVAGYVYDLTGGNPRAIRQTMLALTKEHQDNLLWQPTVADIVALQQKEPQASDKKLPVYSLPSGLAAMEGARRFGKLQIRFLGGAMGLLLILAVLFAIFMPKQRRAATDQLGMTLGLIVPTATPSPTAPPPTSTPKVVRMTATFTVVPPTAVTPSPSPTATNTAVNTPTAVPATATLPPATPTPDLPDALITRAEDNMPMLYIPAGTFLMGTDANNFTVNPDEKPEHEVTLDAFYIDQYEVNLEQYASFFSRLDEESLCQKFDCALARPIASFSYLNRQPRNDGSLIYFPLDGYENYPVNNVSWYGATAYCETMNARLPTEAEWEYAARGDDGRIFPWGDDFPNQNLAVFNSENFENLKPVDALPDGVSPFGVYAMAGSVWEWVADWYGETYYTESPTDNPQGPENGYFRIMRGGSWLFDDQADFIRSANRKALTPDQMHSIAGFRCVRNVEE